MTPGVTRGTAGALVVAGVLHLLARATGVSWLALASAAALALPLASYGWRPPYADLRVSLERPSRVVVGTESVQRVEVVNPGRRPSPAGVLRDLQPGLERGETELPALAPGGTAVLEVRRTAVARGLHTAPSCVLLVTTAPFGALRWTAHRHLTEPMWVHPATTAGAGSVPAGGGVDAAPASGRPGSGTELLGLRPWRAGDALRDVSARASARHGRPVVLERERDAGPALLVLATGGAAGERWEASVSAAASAVLAAVREGRPVELLAGDGGPVPPRPLTAQAVLDFFAEVDRSGPLPAGQVDAALRRLQPGGTVLVLAGTAVPVTAPGRRVEVLGG